jgi:hypothetical protein
MMLKNRDYIGSSPHGEDCAQVGEENYSLKAIKECNSFVGQIRRIYGKEPVGCHLVCSGNPHDFGMYYSVDIEYDYDDQVGLDYFLDIEGDKLEGLEYWDEVAKKELGIE